MGRSSTDYPPTIASTGASSGIRTRTRTRIVGLGASAGGLEPLERFFGSVPDATGFAYVVVQHMDPTLKAMLAELLQRSTSMPVHEVADFQPVEANTVYVIPPNAELSVLNGVFRLAVPSQPRGLRLPIDVLFISLARELGELAVGVVLSGMGSDGTLGLQAIKAQGGLAGVQAPESAQFDSMPKSAIAAGCADVVGLPAELPARILEIVGGPVSALARAASPTVPQPAFDAILGLLHERNRKDLRLYKPNTLIRRIERRMAVHRLETMADYEVLLRDNVQELDLLFKEMLIGVTAFFRDTEVWRDMKDDVLPSLVARRAEDDAGMRAWVVGCSTGEEAFSLAMAYTEVAEATPGGSTRKLQVFATDLSADAIAIARSGLYPATIAQTMAPERLSRFFSERGGGFAINKDIREMVLFAQHDVILDPPFTRLDFLSCRNLMIYFGAALQQRLVPLFHYCLRPGGALLLGGSETVGRSQAMFRPLHPKSRLYWRGDNGVGMAAIHFPTHQRRAPSLPPPLETTLTTPNRPHVNLQSLAEQVLLQGFSPPAVLVNEGGDIVYISGRTGRYLEPAAGKANWNIHVMARPGLRAQLAVALRKALQERTSVELQGLRLDDEAMGSVDITVKAIVDEPRALEGMAMIVFRDVPGAAKRRGRSVKTAGPVDIALSEELLRSREEISALRQETRASQEELQAINEELHSTNEELQSANEELTTSKEEGQSMNEELQTINGELQSKLDDLALAQSDMQNLLNSTDIATLFLDNGLNVRRFTEQIARVVHLRDSDIGRPLSELATTLIYPDLHVDVKETLRTLIFSEKQIATTDSHWFTVRIMPYRTMADVIQGAVITFVDITVAKELESRLRKE